MPQLYKPRFTIVTSNRHKYDEMITILFEEFGINASCILKELTEVQSDSLEYIAQTKALDESRHRAYGRILVEDSGLSVDALNGFPGPYSSYVFEKIGVDGILRLLQHGTRRARFVSVVAYAYDDRCYTFEGTVCGTISSVPRGDSWGYDPIFIPDGSNQMFGEMTASEKNGMSHRRQALVKFAKWYNRSER